MCRRFTTIFAAMALLGFPLSSCGESSRSNFGSSVSISPQVTTEEVLPAPSNDLESFTQCTLDRISIIGPRFAGYCIYSCYNPSNGQSFPAFRYVDDTSWCPYTL